MPVRIYSPATPTVPSVLPGHTYTCTDGEHLRQRAPHLGHVGQDDVGVMGTADREQVGGLLGQDPLPSLGRGPEVPVDEGFERAQVMLLSCGGLAG